MSKKMSLKQKAISGVIWNGAERFGSSLFLFISNLILARLLSPEDFGAIGMLLVFISISQSIVDGGFGSALIQKKTPTQTDYCTVFYWNILLSIILYLVLYLSSSNIARFYGMPILKDVLQVWGVVLLIDGLTIIQRNRLIKELAFKKIAKVNLTGVIIGTIVGIILAYLGYGLWSLIAKTMSTAIIQCVLYWIIGKWKPQASFNLTSFKKLLSFGGYMFINGFTNNIYYNSISLLMGKFSSATYLGYYTQANKMEDIPRNVISAVVTNVTFPLFSSIQDDRRNIQAIASKCTKLLAYTVISLLTYFIIAANSLIIILLGEQWTQSILYFQLLCISGIVLTFVEYYSNIIKSLGKSKEIFIIELSMRFIGIILILVGARWNVVGMICGYVISIIIMNLLLSLFIGKYINYSIISQIKDIYKILIYTTLSAIITFSVSFLTNNKLLLLVYQFFVFLASYIFFSYMFKSEELRYLLQIIIKQKKHE